jgi:hypothetical protein
LRTLVDSFPFFSSLDNLESSTLASGIQQAVRASLHYSALTVTGGIEAVGIETGSHDLVHLGSHGEEH